MKKLLLHIGMPKAGSTAIQHFLKDNELKLADLRIHYLKAGLGQRELVKQSKLAQPFAYTLSPVQTRREPPKVKRDATAENMAQAVTEIATTDFDTYVISVEELFPTFATNLVNADTKVSQMYLEWFQQLSEICQITVLVYLRRQDLFVESLYAQFQKGGGSPLRLLEFHEFLANLNDIGVLDYEQVVANLGQLPGVQHIIVRPFERSQLKDGDAINDFAQILGITDISEFTAQGESNTVNFPRQFSIMLQQAAIVGTDQQLRKTFENMVASGKKLPTWALTASGKYFMSPAERTKLVTDNQAGNDQLAKEYLNQEQLFHSLPSIDEDPNWTPPIVNPSVTEPPGVKQLDATYSPSLQIPSKLKDSLSSVIRQLRNHR